jgi:hypothetical protein
VGHTWVFVKQALLGLCQQGLTQWVQQSGPQRPSRLNMVAAMAWVSRQQLAQPLVQYNLGPFLQLQSQA